MPLVKYFHSSMSLNLQFVCLILGMGAIIPLSDFCIRCKANPVVPLHPLDVCLYLPFVSFLLFLPLTSSFFSQHISSFLFSFPILLPYLRFPLPFVFLFLLFPLHWFIINFSKKNENFIVSKVLRKRQSIVQCPLPPNLPK